MRPSTLIWLLPTFLPFGLVMGIIFPFFASLFVEWKPGMHGWFVAAALGAGVIVGLMNYGLMRIILLGKLQRIADIVDAVSNRNVGHTCTRQSADTIGEIIDSINRMTANLRDIVQPLNNNATQLDSVSKHMGERADASYQEVLSQRAEAENIQRENQVKEAAQGFTTRSDRTRDAVKRARQLTREGSQQIPATLHSIQSLAESTEDIAQRIEQEVNSVHPLNREMAAASRQQNDLVATADQHIETLVRSFKTAKESPR